ncbi:MAG TPA: lysozyme inhibitor LprI family protein [Terracidiphilus sp.]|jgi:uncharacterized protein YecT (DUF1311 family)|nr:lysozyme inhibitor LprI family protein [Terracidiphilus sp.]
MPSLARFLKPWMVFALMGAMLLTLHSLLPAFRAQAQQTPSAPAAVPEPAHGLQNPIPSDQLTFLNAYGGRPARDLLKDKAYERLMKGVIPKTTYHYGRDMSLNDAVDDVMEGAKLPVLLRDGRYLMVNGEQGPYLKGRGFAWFDLQEGIALGGFYFTPTNGEPSPTLTIYSKQLWGDTLAMSELPRAFVEDLYQWEENARVPPVSPRYFIPVNGKKYVLVHDEDYCWHPANTPAPDAMLCEKANAAAADADMNAAYFMQETHNAANATAWMLGPDQVAWLELRDRSCTGPNGLGCRLRMTRERTRVLLGGHPMPRPNPPRASR